MCSAGMAVVEHLTEGCGRRLFEQRSAARKLIGRHAKSGSGPVAGILHLPCGVRTKHGKMVRLHAAAQTTFFAKAIETIL